MSRLIDHLVASVANSPEVQAEIEAAYALDRQTMQAMHARSVELDQIAKRNLEMLMKASGQAWAVVQLRDADDNYYEADGLIPQAIAIFESEAHATAALPIFQVVSPHNLEVRQMPIFRKGGAA